MPMTYTGNMPPNQNVFRLILPLKLNSVDRMGIWNLRRSWRHSDLRPAYKPRQAFNKHRPHRADR